GRNAPAPLLERDLRHEPLRALGHPVGRRASARPGKGPDAVLRVRSPDRHTCAQGRRWLDRLRAANDGPRRKDRRPRRRHRRVGAAPIRLRGHDTWARGRSAMSLEGDPKDSAPERPEDNETQRLEPKMFAARAKDADARAKEHEALPEELKKT